jgi:hypothetical protein
MPTVENIVRIWRPSFEVDRAARWHLAYLAESAARTELEPTPKLNYSNGSEIRLNQPLVRLEEGEVSGRSTTRVALPLRERVYLLAFVSASY